MPYLTGFCTTIMPQPSRLALHKRLFDLLDFLWSLYSPDLSPSDFWLYRILKKHIRRNPNTFSSSSELENCVREFLNNLQQDALREAFDELKTRWIKCIERDGNWFEK